MIVTLLRSAAWLSIITVAIITIGPIGLRPAVVRSADLERFLVFLVIGSLFGIAYPSRLPTILILVIATAALLEYAQNFVPDRHGTINDFVVKVTAGVIGVFVGRLAAQFTNLVP